VIDVGLQRAYREAGRLQDADLADAVRQFIDRVHGGDGDDDITVLAVRPDTAR
jgi:hypothetical protein